MGEYYNALDVASRGKLITYDPARPPKPRSGEKFIGLCDNGLHVIAPDVSNPTEFKVFNDKYEQGLYLDFDIVAVDVKDIETEKVRKGGPYADSKAIKEIKGANTTQREYRW